MRKQNVFIFLFFLNLLIHNAYAYITRKKVKTSILFLILMIILLSLYGCLSILSSNLRMENL